MEIIKEAKRVTNKTYALDFEYRNESGSGFSFDCDKHGNLKELNPEAMENYQKCVSGEYDVVFNGVKEYSNTYTEPAEGKCDCGQLVTLYGFTNTCEGCGADYNSAGQFLAPRVQWGEETGERCHEIY